MVLDQQVNNQINSIRKGYTPLRESSSCVLNKEIFKGNTLYSEAFDNVYVVYSYGPHHPLVVYLYDIDVWYYNTESCSRTTSRHLTVATRDLFKFKSLTIEPLTTTKIKSLLKKQGSGHPKNLKTLSKR